MELAHNTNFHQLSIYGEMLMRLARLSSNYGRQSQVLKVCEEMLENPPSTEYYFDILSYLMERDEFGKVEELLELMEEWSSHKFSKESESSRRISWGETVKDRVKQMKVSIGGKERWNDLRRVEKIIERLGIEDEQMKDEELHEEFHRRELEKLWERIRKHYKDKNWVRFDKAEEGVEVLLSKVDTLKDTWHY